MVRRIMRVRGAPASLLRTDRVEGRFLLVGQRSIEVIHRHTHGLHRLQHGIEPLGNGGEPFRRRQRILRPGRTLARAGKRIDLRLPLIA
jgi:hypothetical protein